jgi:pantoate--beta-alanine ligase
MNIIKDTEEFRRVCLADRCRGLRTALVPTMGYFHEGHLSLMRWARENADRVYVSLFVNPAQFGENEDLESYPRDEERDAGLAEAQGVDVLFTPDRSDLYPPGHATWVEAPELSGRLCGASRPVFFRGVATVVAKLLNLALPNVAVFGEKDRQQLVVVRRMARDLNFPTEIVGRPTVRERDGLAMSSRNVYLSSDERRQAAHISRGLRLAVEAAQAGQRDAAGLKSLLLGHFVQEMPDAEVDYVEVVDGESMRPVETAGPGCVAAAAVRLGKARLIDNMVLLEEGS